MATVTPISSLEPTAPKPRVPLVPVNVILLLLALALIRYNSLRLFQLHIPDLLSLKTALSAGGLAAFTLLVPARIRKRALVAVRRILNSRRTLYVSAAAFVLNLFPLLVIPIQVRWVGPESMSLNKNGHDITVDAPAHSNGVREATVYDLIGSKVEIRAGAYGSTIKAEPLRNRIVTLPFYATSPFNLRLAHAEYRILSAFYSLFDRKDLASIYAELETLAKSSALDKGALLRLRRIRDIVDGSANTPATISTKLSLVDNFADAYPDDPWIRLLKAEAQYGVNNFAECVRVLQESPTSSTASTVESIYATEDFFRGVCEMKSIVTAPGSPTSQRDGLMMARANIASGAVRLQATNADQDTKDIARISSTIYSAICEFYSGNMQAALVEFQKVAAITSNGQAARAHNNAGFSAFVPGNFVAARSEYDQAYRAEPTWPYIRANFAYLTLAQGDVASARATFNSIASDLDLQQSSPQDVLLAKLMLIELDQDSGTPMKETDSKYAALLASKGGATWDFEGNDDIRYALLVDETIKKIYLDGDYFGLEMFALSTACKAKTVLSKANPESQEHQAALQNIQSDIDGLRGRVSAVWLTTKHTGWFSHLGQCN